LQWSIWWWCESRCSSRCTPLINPSKWALLCRWCNVTQTWIPNRSYTRWWWCCRCLVVLSWGSWTQRYCVFKGLCVTS
jgi:hypothetical protein